MTATADRTIKDDVTDNDTDPTDEAVRTSAASASPSAETGTKRDAESGNGPARRALPVALLALAAALFVAGTIFLVRADRLGDTSATNNDAVVDKARTSEVIGQVSTALNQVLSYDYQRPQVAQAAGKKWLTGDAPAQYRTLFAKLQQLAAGQKLTLVARVVTAGVTSLRGDTAQLLVFLDQQSTRASDQKSSVSAAQVQVTAVRTKAGYRISELNPI